jgi:hypothetical protein
MLCSGEQVVWFAGALDVIGQIADFDGASLPQKLEEAKSLRLDRPARRHHLAADTVAKDLAVRCV